MYLEGGRSEVGSGVGLQAWNVSQEQLDQMRVLRLTRMLSACSYRGLMQFSCSTSKASVRAEHTPALIW